MTPYLNFSILALLPYFQCSINEITNYALSYDFLRGYISHAPYLDFIFVTFRALSWLTPISLWQDSEHRDHLLSKNRVKSIQLFTLLFKVSLLEKIINASRFTPEILIMKTTIALSIRILRRRIIHLVGFYFSFNLIKKFAKFISNICLNFY